MGMNEVKLNKTGPFFWKIQAGCGDEALNALWWVLPVDKCFSIEKKFAGT